MKIRVILSLLLVLISVYIIIAQRDVECCEADIVKAAEELAQEAYDTRSFTWSLANDVNEQEYILEQMVKEK